MAGLGAGGLWSWARHSQRRRLIYLCVWAVLFAAVLAAAAAADPYLSRTLSFVGPLAAIVMLTTGAGTALLTESGRVLGWMAAAALLCAVGVGIGLATQGDAESGELKLPPRALSQAGPDEVVQIRPGGPSSTSALVTGPCSTRPSERRDRYCECAAPAACALS